MSSAWRERKSRLDKLLGIEEDEDAWGLALDRILHGQSVIGRTSKTAEIDKTKFGEKDLNVLGTLEYGQYGVIDVVTCKQDGKAYVRKSIEKKFALRTQDQCSPQFERDILLRAFKSRTQWAPHLLCAFQTESHLNLVMEYAEGGTLWDVLESSPFDGRISETDVQWWAPQIVSAIDWCHSQGFVHRDVKPHNFVLNATGHILLIDFGSAAPLLPKCSDGSQRVPKKHCLVPCGTCDYISPEILQCHEEALVALEMADNIDDPPSIAPHEPGGYGRETDWWSFGAMLYEMVYGTAPFFADDIRQTYLKIMDHHRSLRLKPSVHVSSQLQDLIRRFLTDSELRLGRQSAEDIRAHAFFEYTSWNNLHLAPKPDDLHLPQFTYAAPSDQQPDLDFFASPSTQHDSRSAAFAFSAFFQSSPGTSQAFYSLHQTPSQKSILRDRPTASFIGFSWGPSIDAFDGAINACATTHVPTTPRVLKTPFTPLSTRITSAQVTPQRLPFATPVRQSYATPIQTLPRASTVRRTAQRRAVSDREAMKQLVNCVGMSARKKVLESGRKPRILTSASRSSRSSTLKELRFDRSVMVFNGDSGGVSYRMDPTTTTTSESAGGASFSLMSASTMSGGPPARDQDVEPPITSESESSLDSEFMYSPSPSPRPLSAMSNPSSRRSQTPTIPGSGSRGSHILQAAQNNILAADSRGRVSPSLLLDPEWQNGGPSKPMLTDIMTNRNLSFEALDDLEQRYTRLMSDIAGISERLEGVAMQVITGTSISYA